MRTRTYGVLYLLAAVAITVVVLKAINWLPMALQKETMRKYNSVEEVRNKLNIRHVYVPTYFPPSIVWPPTEILAQTRPYPAVLMVFRRPGGKDPALVITQADSDAFPGSTIISFSEVRQKVDYWLKNRKTLLEVGVCRKDECSRMSWTEGNTRITLTMKSPPFELIRIADSMLHDETPPAAPLRN